MSIQAKICGLSTAETVDAAVAAGASFVGFMTYPRSPRHVASDELLAALGARVPRSVIRVGVFVDPDDALLDRRLATGAIDLLQLHGAETPERLAEIKARWGKPVMKVIKVSQACDVERGIAAYAGVAERLMFDAAEGILPGGNAEPFDWAVLSGRRVPLPWFLAGGLTPENLAVAVKVTGSVAVDVSSGVESSRGVKSIERIRAFLECAKAL
jgi:phosphoribosylanthranilate isomerase